MKVGKLYEAKIKVVQEELELQRGNKKQTALALGVTPRYLRHVIAGEPRLSKWKIAAAIPIMQRRCVCAGGYAIIEKAHYFVCNWCCLITRMKDER